MTNATEDRTDAQADRAAPVSLPAGSYDASALSDALNESAKAKHDKERADLRAKTVDELNETETPVNTMGVPPGYKRVEVDNDELGVKESRVVYDVDQREVAEEAQANVQQPIDPKVAAEKGE